MNYEWYEKRFWRSELTFGMPCVCFMDSVNKGLPTEMQHIQQINRVLRHAANKQVPHKARQIKAGKSQYDCKYIQLHSLIWLILCAISAGGFLHESNCHAFKTEREIEEKMNIVVKIHKLRKDGWRIKANKSQHSHKHNVRPVEREAIDFSQKCQFIILGDTCDRSLLSFVCDFVRFKAGRHDKFNPLPHI